MFLGPIPHQSTTWNQCEPTHRGDTYGECTKQGGNTKKERKQEKKEKWMIVKIAQTLIVVVNKAPNHAFLMSFKSEWKDQKRIQNREWNMFLKYWNKRHEKAKGTGRDNLQI